jgi:O-antigen/teichoic acid export membrane protein
MSLRKQAISLAIMYTAEVVQPLLVLPYLGRVLGSLQFGKYAYALSIGAFAATLVEYGFHWTAQRAAAAARHEPAAITALFAEVAVTKSLLCVVVTIAGLAAAEGILTLSKALFLFTMLTSFGNILFPAWLFIGLERAWQAAVAVVIARALSVAFVLALVTSSTQLEMAVAIQAGIPLVSGVLSLPFVTTVGLGGFRNVTLSRVGAQLLNGWRGFLYSFVERTLTTVPVPLVAHFSGYVAAGQYSVAEKFVTATRPLFRVLSETFLPRVAYYARHDPAAGLALIWKSLPSLAIGAVFSVCVYFLAPYIIILLFGSEFSGAIPIVRILSVVPILMNANILTSNLYMFNFGHERAWAALTVLGLLVFLAVAYLLSVSLLNAAVAVAIAVIAKESVVLVVSAGYFLAFGTARAKIAPTTADDGPPAAVHARSSELVSIVALPVGDQIRPER